ncbi:hypothetical protein [Microbacterium rhizosphaerae]|uniref:Terminase n=1 Tax=Microbacterium rhizosphaerae TaxID=1678237 RepID=A0ABZ0SIK5_9MICO|nr:hypothetical protein [Microbacterium rhizosphaerae]WPR88393.1 hypothetical protein SM116_11450 [Microbacterium rhizosphaerae]
MSDTKPIATPRTLGAAGKALHRAIARQWAELDLIPDAREAALLLQAARESDVLAALDTEVDAAISAGKVTVTGAQGQPVEHPAIGAARRSRTTIQTLLRSLSFDVPADAEGSIVGLPAPHALTPAEMGRKGGLSRSRKTWTA